MRTHGARLTRRSWLRSLVGSGVGLGLATPVTEVPTSDDLPDTLVWGAWTLRWIDYSRPIAQDLRIGAWIAEESQTGRLAHWLTTGTGDFHRPGYVFSTVQSPAWPILMSGSAPDLCLATRRRAYEALIAFLGLDRNGLGHSATFPAAEWANRPTRR